MFYNYNNTNKFQFENPFYQFSLLSYSPGFGGRKNGTLIYVMLTRSSAHGKVYRLSKQTTFSYRKRQVIVSDIPIYRFIADSNFSSVLFKNGTFCTYYGYWDDKTARVFCQETFRVASRQFFGVLCFFLTSSVVYKFTSRL